MIDNDGGNWSLDIGLRVVHQFSSLFSKGGYKQSYTAAPYLVPEHAKGWLEDVHRFFGSTIDEDVEIVIGTTPRTTRNSPAPAVKNAARIAVEETTAVCAIWQTMWLSNPERAVDIRADKMPSFGANAQSRLSL